MLVLGLWLTAAAGFDFDAALADGEYAEVLAAAERVVGSASADSDSASETARLAALVAAQRTGRVDAVARFLGELEGVELGAFAADLSLWTASARGECAAAEALGNGLDEAHSAYASAGWSRVARCYARAEDLPAAQRATERFVATADTRGQRAAAGLLRAELHVEAGEPEVAVPLLRGLIAEFPRTSQADDAQRDLDRLRRRGIRGSRLSPVELVAQADRDRADQRLAPAQKAYEDILHSQKPRALPALLSALGLAEIDMVRRSYNSALKRIDTVVDQSRDAAASARALYLQGDVLSRRGRVQEALASYDRLQREMPDDPFTIEGTLAALRLAYGARQDDTALAQAQWLLDHPSPERTAGRIVADDGVVRDSKDLGSAQDHALWTLAWLSRRQGRPGEEMDSYLQNLTADGPFATDALYWRLRLAHDRGDREAAQVFADLLTAKQPLSFQALLAADLLGPTDSCPVSPLGDVPALASAPGPAAKDILGPMVLFQHGLQQTARDVLRTIPASDLSWEDRVAAAWLYRRCGDLHIGAVLARRAAQNAQREGLDPMLLELAFPQPFEDEVRHWSQKYDVPLALVYAIMREESAFDPKARSARFARGLMQMIPQTARAMAEEAARRDHQKPRRRFASSKLYEPGTSVQLGVLYLRALLERFDGNLPATIAAYHAGEQAVDRWLASRGELAADEFIEQIPFASTRGYTKRVLASYAIYRVLYAPAPGPAFDIDLTRAPMAGSKVAAR